MTSILPTTGSKAITIYKCDQCSFKCHLKCNLVAHRSRHTKDRLHICRICHRTFVSRYQLLRHKITHTSKRTFNCDMCQYSSRHEGIYLLHRKRHEKNHLTLNKDDNDQESGKQISQSNLFLIDGNGKQFKCSYCEFKCTENVEMQTHIRKHTGENHFRCKVCPYECRLKVCLLNHMKTHNDERPFKCDQCNAGFLRKAHLLRHITIHSDEKPFKCQLCNYSCRIIYSLKVHMKTHSGGKRFKCHLCDKTFGVKDNLRRHMFVHTGEGLLAGEGLKLPLSLHTENKPHKCPFCDYAGSSATARKKHIRSRHTEERPYKCGQCESSFAEKGTLKLHMRTHTDEKPFKCDTCHYSTNRKGSLVRHMEHKHKRENMFKCNKCDFMCFSQTDIGDHAREHYAEETDVGTYFRSLARAEINPKIVVASGPYVKNDMGESTTDHKAGLFTSINLLSVNKPFKCEQCDFAGKSKHSLDCHKKKHIGRATLVCGICNKTSSSSYRLKQHMTVHTGEKMFKCDLCDYSCNCIPRLEIHKRKKHTGEMPFKCQYCLRAYADSVSLKIHLKTHSDERPYKCSTCSAAFKYMYTLKLHMTTHSKERPFKCDICGLALRFQSNLTEHRKTHAEERSFKCAICQFASRSKQGLKAHVKLHTDDKPHKCTYCDFACLKPATLKNHVRAKHTNERPYKCDQCDSSFAVKGNLTSHMEKHRVDKQFKCDKCDFETHRKFGLIKHKRRKHTKEHKYQCNRCDFICFSLPEIEDHALTHSAEDTANSISFNSSTNVAVNLHHPKIGNARASHVKDSTSESEDSRTLTQAVDEDEMKTEHSHDHGTEMACSQIKQTKVNVSQMVTELNSNRYATEEDSKDFNVGMSTTENNQKSTWIYHPTIIITSRMESQESISIGSLSDKAFGVKDGLRRHTVVNTDDRLLTGEGLKPPWSLHTENKPHKCTLCNYAGRTSSALRKHIRSRHTKERPYKCSQCESSFAEKGTLKLHMRTHTNEKPFKCDTCHYSTNRKGSLVRHMEHKHKRENMFKCNKCDFTCVSQTDIGDHARKHNAEETDVGTYFRPLARAEITSKIVRTSGPNSKDDIEDDAPTHSVEDSEGFNMEMSTAENYQKTTRIYHPADSITYRRESLGNIGKEYHLSVSVKQEPITEEGTPEQLRNRNGEGGNTGLTTLNVLANVKNEADLDIVSSEHNGIVGQGNARETLSTSPGPWMVYANETPVGMVVESQASCVSIKEEAPSNLQQIPQTSLVYINRCQRTITPQIIVENVKKESDVE